jgi:TolB protein
MRVRSSILGALVVLGVASAHASADVDASGSWIVFSALPKGLPPAQLFRVETTGAGLEQLTTGTAIASEPAFSPDGKRVVFTRLGQGIFVVNLEGSGLRQLTKGNQDHFPVWSPNGRHIAFLRVVGKAWRLFLINPSGAGLHRLPEAPPAGRPTWTADSKSIYMPVLGALDRIDARTGRVQKRIPVSIDPFTGHAATMSPNARNVVFVGPNASAPGCGDVSCVRFALYLAQAPKWKAKKFTTDTGPAGWSPDGKSLIFVTHNRLHVWPLAGGTRTSIETGHNIPSGDAPPAWQPR